MAETAMAESMIRAINRDMIFFIVGSSLII